MMNRLLFAILILGLCGCKSSEDLSALPVGEFAPQPDTVTIVIKGYKPQAGKAFQNLFVSNFSVRVSQGQLWYSTARDGFWDAMKQSLIGTYGFKIQAPETVVQGFSDLLLFDAGIDIAQQPMMFCAASLMGSSSFDAFQYNDGRLLGNPQEFIGLRDCEKMYMGLNPQLFDFNEDGIPDYIEMQCGMSPLNKGIAQNSTAGDGVSDLDKCKRHIPIDENAFTQPNQIFAYQYGFQLNQDGTTDFTIANIPILNGGVNNFLTFTVTETDTGTGPAAIYTAYAIPTTGYAGRTLEFSYWVNGPGTLTDKQIVVPP